MTPFGDPANKTQQPTGAPSGAGGSAARTLDRSMTVVARNVLIVAGILLLLGSAILSGIGVFELLDDGWFWPMAPYGAGLLAPGVACLVLAGRCPVDHNR